METSREGGKKLWAAEGGCDGGRNDRGRDTNSPAGSLAGINNIRRAAEHSGLAAPPSGGGDGEGGTQRRRTGRKSVVRASLSPSCHPTSVFSSSKRRGEGRESSQKCADGLDFRQTL